MCAFSWEKVSVESSTFSKRERLSKKKRIQELFTKGSSFFLYPYKVYYLTPTDPDDLEYPVQILISVSKRKFKRAVDRNAIKRLTREAYRTQKQSLLNACCAEKQTVVLGLVYVADKEQKFKLLQKKIKQTLFRLEETIQRS